MSDVSQAILAWQQFRPMSPLPRHADPIKATRKTLVCRLEGVGPGGNAVIVKRSKKKIGRLEFQIYDQVLCKLPLVSVRCYGFLDPDAEEHTWLFLEDRGNATLEHRFDSFRSSLAQWLGIFHATASAAACGIQLPDRGPAHYLQTLRYSRQVFASDRSEISQLPAYQPLYERLLPCFDVIEERWEQIVGCCSELPWTLVHGDFRSHNILACFSPSGPVLFPIDWGDCGWGPPATDLKGIDVDTYCDAARGVGFTLPAGIVREQVRCGAIFKLLAAIGWEADWLRVGAPERAFSQLQWYVPDLLDAARAFGAEV